MALAATFVLMALILSSTSASTLQLPSPTTAENTNTIADHGCSLRLPTSGKRICELASKIKRRERAINFGFYIPKPSQPNSVFLEVPRELRNEAKSLIKGKILKTTRENLLGHSTHTTRSASLETFKTSITSKEQFAKDTRTAKKQNAANHGSPKKRIPWADTFDEENEENIPELANRFLKAINHWWTNAASRNQPSHQPQSLKDSALATTPAKPQKANRKPRAQGHGI